LVICNTEINHWLKWSRSTTILRSRAACRQKYLNTSNRSVPVRPFSHAQSAFMDALTGGSMTEIFLISGCENKEKYAANPCFPFHISLT